MAEIPQELESVKVLRLEPGDVIVAKLADHHNYDVAEKARMRLEECFPGYKVVILGGIDVEVQRGISTFHNGPMMPTPHELAAIALEALEQAGFVLVRPAQRDGGDDRG